jgi:hypothetical protein
VTTNLPPLDLDERLLWAIMRMFEQQARAQYVAHVPELAALKDALDVLPGDGGELVARSVLGAPMDALVASAAAATDEVAVLVVQGLVLERVRQVVYATLARTGAITVTPGSRSSRVAANRRPT